MSPKQEAKSLNGLIHAAMESAPPDGVYTAEWIREEVERRFPDEVAAHDERLINAGWNAAVTKAMQDAKVEDEQLELFEGVPAVITVAPRQWKRMEEATDDDLAAQESFMAENARLVNAALERFRAFRAAIAPVLAKFPGMTVREALRLMD